MKKLGERKWAVIIIALLFLCATLIIIFKGSVKYELPKTQIISDKKTTDLTEKVIKTGTNFYSKDNSLEEGQTNFKDKEILVDEDFTTHLPLVVIDTNGEEPKRSVYWDLDKGYYVPLDKDQYVYGQISIIDNKNDVNILNQNPQLNSDIKIKVRGNSSGNYDKKQYLIKCIDDKGKRNSVNVLGMGKDSEWILNISFIDKSLLRNYLAYTVAGEVMKYTPDAKYCEVVWKNKDKYEYKGVYLMMESISVSKNRVDLPKYSENSANIPFILRRDRYNPNGIMLDNYASLNNLTLGYLDVEYPDKDIIKKSSIKKITNKIDKFEKSLFDEDYDNFIKYRDYVNINTFVDYFILNEFFLNYDAGYNSTYMYSNYSGKLNIGPVWDFDQAIDNNTLNKANVYTTAFHDAPWFNKMLKDPQFTNAIITRYKQSRKSILSDDEIEKFIDSTVKYLNSAIDRDWARWGYYYTDQNSLSGNSNTKTYQEEINHIKYILTEHGKWLDKHMDSLYQFSQITLEDSYNNQKQNKHGNVMAITFIIIFFSSVILVTKFENE